jgi:glutamate carboxypeptidase
MNATASKAVCDWLAAHRGEMLELLEATVGIDSGSSHKAGADRMAATMAAFLESAGLEAQRHALSTHGDCVTAQLGGAGPGHVLLLGHMDTVFPVGTATKRPFRLAGDLAHGPGVADMKAGIVMNAFVARAFAELGAKVPPIHVLFTGDEEVASPPPPGHTRPPGQGARPRVKPGPGAPHRHRG